ncbi:MAG: alginate export family protein [Spongiibacteraceae bacterium]
MRQVGLKSGIKQKTLVAAVLGVMAAQASADALVDALAKSKVSGNFRLRYETVDLDSASTKDATALTLRSRLGIETAPLSGFTGILEFENTQVLNGEDEYAPETTGYAPIVDPDVTEVNRAYLRYRGISKLDLGLGRQRIVLDNQRFVGGVAWRQDEQTFDSFTANYTGIPDWAFYYAYVDKVNGIASEKPTFNFDLDSSDSLLNVAYTGLVFGKITAYAYLLDNEESSTALRNLAPDVNALNPTLRYQTNDTLGLRFDGFYLLPITLPIRLLYTAEYAQQEYTNATGVEFDTDYSFIDIGAGYASSIGMLTARVAQETLGSDQVGTALQGFQTPYATKHAFNGWVDMFLNTPAGGLKDQYLQLGADLAPYGVKVMAFYHEYSEVDGPVTGGGARDFGSEWNLQVLKQFGANYTLGIKYGDYKADNEVATLIGTTANVDTQKFWLWGELNF